MYQPPPTHSSHDVSPIIPPNGPTPSAEVNHPTEAPDSPELALPYTVQEELNTQVHGWHAMCQSLSAHSPPQLPLTREIIPNACAATVVDGDEDNASQEDFTTSAKGIGQNEDQDEGSDSEGKDEGEVKASGSAPRGATRRDQKRSLSFWVQEACNKDI